MNLKPWYVDKIKNYSHMQYGILHSNKLDFKPNESGFEFFNMGLMVINCAQFKRLSQGTNTETIYSKNGVQGLC